MLGGKVDAAVHIQRGYLSTHAQERLVVYVPLTAGRGAGDRVSRITAHDKGTDGSYATGI